MSHTLHYVPYAFYGTNVTLHGERYVEKPGDLTYKQLFRASANVNPWKGMFGHYTENLYFDTKIQLPMLNLLRSIDILGNEDNRNR